MIDLTPKTRSPRPRRAYPRISEESHRWFEAHWRTQNTGTEFLLDLFPTLYEEALDTLQGTFSPDELMELLDSYNGVRLEPRFAGEHIVRLLPSTEAKFQGLDILSRICVEIWASGFWSSGAYGEDGGLERWVSRLGPVEQAELPYREEQAK